MTTASGEDTQDNPNWIIDFSKQLYEDLKNLENSDNAKKIL